MVAGLGEGRQRQIDRRGGEGEGEKEIFQYLQTNQENNS